MNMAIGLMCLLVSFILNQKKDTSIESQREFCIIMKNTLLFVAFIYMTVDIVCLLG